MAASSTPSITSHLATIQNDNEEMTSHTIGTTISTIG